MAKFDVTIEPTAESDLRGILRYITEILKEPFAAGRIFYSIKEHILTLDQSPLRYPLVRDELFAARGLRRMPAENYSVFYTADENSNEVHVLRVLYNRREWQNLI
ncbi:MAG: type II toxin-antitoxin system RelE/ParE family toxin [Oscillospiraceae bacterium]|nr:type II toxin-antitoxin system RelE/ParE family toxin [Oscillospiraceae bacterium]